MDNLSEPGTPLTPPTEPSDPNFGPSRSSGMATLSLWLGIAGFLTSCVFIGIFPGIAALIVGIVAIGQIDNPANRLHGRGKATTGAIFGGSAILMAFIVPLLIGIMLPALGAARRTARQMQNNTQVRSIHQAAVIYSQNNNGFFPGLTAQGEILEDGPMTTGDSGNGATPAARMWIMLDGNYFTSDYAISPSETLTPWAGGHVLPSEFSYALLDISEPGGRRDEWRDTLNTEAAVISDRNTGVSGDPADYMSIHTDTPGDWRGSVVWNDNHVVFETDAILYTKYADYAPNPNDNLFEAAGANDAMMIHDGE